jgi:hypothetical protein
MRKSYSAMHNLLLAGLIFLAVFTACNDTYEVDPIVATFPVADSNITSTSAKLTGQIQLLGTIKITEYGMELYKNTITNMVAYKGFSDTATLDTFTVVFTGLDPNTKYYYWAYALVNTTRVHSQNVPTFTTKAAK